MTEIEQKALALVNEVVRERSESPWIANREADAMFEAFCRAIEQHEAFRREVSDAVVRFYDAYGSNSIAPPWSMVCRIFDGFIIPKPVDPLVEVIEDAWGPDPSGDNYTRTSDNLRAAMKARGYEFTKIGEGGE